MKRAISILLTGAIVAGCQTEKTLSKAEMTSYAISECSRVGFTGDAFTSCTRDLDQKLIERNKAIVADNQKRLAGAVLAVAAAGALVAVAANSGGGGGYVPSSAYTPSSTYQGYQPQRVYTGNCPTPNSIAADGSRCGARSAATQPGGYDGYSSVAAPSINPATTVYSAPSVRTYTGNCPTPESLDAAGHRCGARSAASRAGGYDGYGSWANTPSYSSGGTVNVRGYYRKDGTYVRGYTRRR
ncbi:hypothetical protein [Rhizobium binxianense]